MAIICACLPTVRPLFAGISSLLVKTSSSMRQRYNSARGQYSQAATDIPDSEVSRSGDAVEIFPLSQQKCRCGASNQNRASVETFPPWSRQHECYCGASLQDPRMKTVLLRSPEDGYSGSTVEVTAAETFRMGEELANSRGQRMFAENAV
jgi:hypothetical protein